jgi:putative addiction module CopG family antidote
MVKSVWEDAFRKRKIYKMSDPIVIHVAPEIEADIRQRVERGEYADESEVLREALRELDRWEQRVQGRGMSIAEGLAALERGEGAE